MSGSCIQMSESWIWVGRIRIQILLEGYKSILYIHTYIYKKIIEFNFSWSYSNYIEQFINIEKHDLFIKFKILCFQITWILLYSNNMCYHSYYNNLNNYESIQISKYVNIIEACFFIIYLDTRILYMLWYLWSRINIFHVITR